jgi:hypothetical protein
MLRNGAGLHHVQTLSWTYDIFGFSTFENNNDLNKGIGDFVTRTIKYGEDAPGTWNSILLCVLRHPFFVIHVFFMICYFYHIMVYQ